MWSRGFSRLFGEPINGRLQMRMKWLYKANRAPAGMLVFS
jgi:hypothetical protein